MAYNTGMNQLTHLQEAWETHPTLAQSILQGHHALHHYYHAFATLPVWNESSLISLIQTLQDAASLPPTLMGVETTDLNTLATALEDLGQSQTLQIIKSALHFCHENGATH